MKQITRMAAAELAQEEIADLLAFLGDMVQTDRERMAIQRTAEYIACQVLDRLGMFSDSD